jgi:hypothetical protein
LPLIPIRTSEGDSAAESSTFTQRKRRAQFADCMADATGELGFSRAPVAEVTRHPNGLLTGHFGGCLDLIAEPRVNEAHA